MRPDEAITALVLKQHGAFTKRQALDLGFTEDAIRHRRKTGRWTKPVPGILVLAGTPSTLEQRAMIATLAYSGVASHRTAASLLGLAPATDGQVHITLAYGKHRRGRPGIVVHQANLGRGDIRRVANIPVTSPNRTLVDIAGEASLDEALRLRLTTVPALRRYMESHRSSAELRRLLDDREDGATQSALERLFLRKLRAAKLPEPRRQFAMGRYRIDFAWPIRKIAVELDGIGSHFSAAHFRSDLRRQNELVLAGWVILRFTWEDVAELWPTTEVKLRDALEIA